MWSIFDSFTSVVEGPLSLYLFKTYTMMTAVVTTTATENRSSNINGTTKTVILPLGALLVVCDGETDLNGWTATLLQLDASIEGPNSVAVIESANYNKVIHKNVLKTYMYAILG